MNIWSQPSAFSRFVTTPLTFFSLLLKSPSLRIGFYVEPNQIWLYERNGTKTTKKSETKKLHVTSLGTRHRMTAKKSDKWRGVPGEKMGVTNRTWISSRHPQHAKIEVYIHDSQTDHPVHPEGCKWSLEWMWGDRNCPCHISQGLMT